MPICARIPTRKSPVVSCFAYPRDLIDSFLISAPPLMMRWLWNGMAMMTFEKDHWEQIVRQPDEGSVLFIVVDRERDFYLYAPHINIFLVLEGGEILTGLTQFSTATAPSDYSSQGMLIHALHAIIPFVHSEDVPLLFPNFSVHHRRRRTNCDDPSELGVGFQRLRHVLGNE